MRQLRSWTRTHPPTVDASREVVDLAMQFIGVNAVRRTFATHRTADAVGLTLEAFNARLDQVVDADRSWTEVCDEFDGRNAVSLMTVHKSKGLEYHTVFFLSIDDQQWWSFRREQEASTANFFVGLSRAEQRTIFTYCAARGDRNAVKALYRLLESAGVEERQP